MIPVRPDDPPSTRLTGLLVAALAALAFLLGGWSVATAPISVAVAAEPAHEDVAPGDAATERRGVRAERRARRRSPSRTSHPGRHLVRRAAVVLARTVLVWRSGPLRGPPHTSLA